LPYGFPITFKATYTLKTTKGIKKELPVWALESFEIAYI